jgi:hypothetical protein
MIQKFVWASFLCQQGDAKTLPSNRQISYGSQLSRSYFPIIGIRRQPPFCLKIKTLKHETSQTPVYFRFFSLNKSINVHV